MAKRMKSVGFISPSNSSSKSKDKNEIYKQEKALLKDHFSKLGASGQIDWTSPEVSKKLKAFAAQVIKTTVDVVPQLDLVSLVLPAEILEVGDTFVLNELSGSAVHYGTYSAAVRMSRPQFTKYSATTNLKEVGLNLDLAQIQRGKYSATELGEYTAAVIAAWKNRLLYVTTLAGSTVYQSGGAQYEAGGSLTETIVITGLTRLTDEVEAKVLVARRNSIHILANNTGFSDQFRNEFEQTGMYGKFLGIPVVKANSFTDKDYGTIAPFPDDDLWLFAETPAGRYVQAGPLRTSDELVLQNENLNIYYRWDDGIGIFHEDRIVRFGAVT